MNQYRSVDLGDGYVVHFVWDKERAWLHTQVGYEGTLVAWCRLRSHLRAARWTKREVRKHKKAMNILREVR